MITGAKVSGTITGISGKFYLVNDLDFDADSYHFIYGNYQQDVTNDITRADKMLLVPDLDIDKENRRLSLEKRDGSGGTGIAEKLDESTTSILVDQLITDPLGAPIEALNNGFDKLVASPGVRKLALLGFLGLVVYFVVRPK